MTYDFSQIPFAELKAVYGAGINAILSQEGLTIPATLVYANNKPNFCNNCVFDPVTGKSSNVYNNNGPNPFEENSICPVCLGMGSISSEATEKINIAALFDSKYWINIDPRVVNIADSMVQTISKTTLLPKLTNANEIYFNNISTERYIRAGDPKFAGLGNSDYIFLMWKHK